MTRRSDSSCIIQFSHAVIAVTDMTSAVAAYRRLGFIVADPLLHPAGAMECLIRFRNSHVVLLGASEPQKSTERENKTRADMIELLKGRQARLLSYGLRSRDLAATAEFLQQQGLETKRIDHSVTRPDGAAWSWSLLVPAGKLWQQPWPFIFQSWLDGVDNVEAWLTGRGRAADPHPNGATDCDSLVVGVSSLESGDHLFRRRLGLTVARGSQDSYEVGRFRISVCAAAPEAIGPQEIVFKVGELSATRSCLESTKIDAVLESGKLKPGRDACLGVSLSFVTGSTE